MPDTHPEDSSLLIRCPSCGQRFKVGEELRDRTVECGACEHRFRINDDVIVRSRKFYPGEHKDPLLHRFQRVPLPLASSVRDPGVNYAPPPDPAKVEPISPQRVIAGAIGVAGMVFMALLLIFGASRGGMLDGMVTSKRLLMAVFTSLIGLVLLWYANPRTRKKAMSFGLLLSAGLCAIPFFVTEGSVPLHSLGPENGVATTQEEPPDDGKSEPERKLRAKIGTEPLDDDIERYEAENLGKTALGLWVHNLEEAYRFMIRDYIERVANSEEPPHFYPRGNGDFLLVIPGVTITPQELAGLATPLGDVIAVHDDLAIVEVQVHNDYFVEGPIEKLSNRENPAFYDLNKRELESIGLDRIQRAVERLAEAEPKIYRTDITRKLIALLESKGVDFKEDVCRALLVWAEDPGPAGEAALREVKRLLAAGSPVPDDMIRLMVKARTSGTSAVVDQLWFEEPTRWETLYGELGNLAEDTMLRRFPELKGTRRYSAVRILGKIGAQRSLEMLEQPMENMDSELEVLVSNAKQSISQRIGQ
ncbi:MAG: hypothetical protein H7A49_07960 [Akkermansiaceae bacterium]|nr:hypothetical protein [Akkermansiaceae bacterium]